MSTIRVFDQSHYGRLNPSREAVVQSLLAEMMPKLGLETAMDVACGLGHFSGYLRSIGFRVTAVDGRGENVEEANRRYPGIEFHTIDAQSAALSELGQFDLVLCFGLLYHLENPFLTVRYLYRLTSKLLLVESVTYPGSEPTMELVDETPNEDQGLRHIAFYPTEACLVKMMYRAGFQHVFRFTPLPDHPHYRGSRSTPRLRTMLAASHQPLQTSLLETMADSKNPLKWRSDDEEPELGFIEKLRRYKERLQPGKLSAGGHT